MPERERSLLYLSKMRIISGVLSPMGPIRTLYLADPPPARPILTDFSIPHSKSFATPPC
jgi:hypothetical protein